MAHLSEFALKLMPWVTKVLKQSHITRSDLDSTSINGPGHYSYTYNNAKNNNKLL